MEISKRQIRTLTFCYSLNPQHSPKHYKDTSRTFNREVEGVRKGSLLKNHQKNPKLIEEVLLKCCLSFPKDKHCDEGTSPFILAPKVFAFYSAWRKPHTHTHHLLWLICLELAWNLDVSLIAAEVRQVHWLWYMQTRFLPLKEIKKERVI